MIETSIKKDRIEGAFTRRLKKSMPLWLVILAVAANILFYTSWIYPAFLVAALIVSTPWIFHGRNKWGEELIFTPERLTVMKAGEIANVIVAASLLHKKISSTTFSCLWEKVGQKKFMMVGRESFSDDGWQKLADAANYLTVPTAK